MAHSKVTKRAEGKLWHLEDSGLTLSDAHALARHLRHTEDKRARVIAGPKGNLKRFQVWWAK
jgi:hypothetical protein